MAATVAARPAKHPYRLLCCIPVPRRESGAGRSTRAPALPGLVRLKNRARAGAKGAVVEENDVGIKQEEVF